MNTPYYYKYLKYKQKYIQLKNNSIQSGGDKKLTIIQKELKYKEYWNNAIKIFGHSDLWITFWYWQVFFQSPRDVQSTIPIRKFIDIQKDFNFAKKYRSDINNLDYPDDNKLEKLEDIAIKISKLSTTKDSKIAKYNKDKEIITWNNITFPLKKVLYDKLKNKVTDINKIFQLIFRYNTVGIYGSNEQLAVPDNVKKMWKNKYNINTELFASALNNYYPNFYSLFPDIEKEWGSLGSFNDIVKPSTKVFANPPFDEIIINETVKKLCNWCLDDKEFGALLTIPIWDSNRKLINDYDKYEIDNKCFNSNWSYKAIAILFENKYKNINITIEAYGKKAFPYINHVTNKLIPASRTYLIYFGSIQPTDKLKVKYCNS